MPSGMTSPTCEWPSSIVMGGSCGMGYTVSGFQHGRATGGRRAYHYTLTAARIAASALSAAAHGHRFRACVQAMELWIFAHWRLCAGFSGGCHYCTGGIPLQYVSDKRIYRESAKISFQYLADPENWLSLDFITALSFQ